MTSPETPKQPEKKGPASEPTLAHNSVPGLAGDSGRGSAGGAKGAAPGASGGTKIGKYRVIKLLGAGGMGVVYEATDSVLARPVALKVLPQEVSRDEETLKRFIREARLAARLSHPNVVTVYDIARQGDSCYIAMELVRGNSLQKLLESTGALGYAEATRVTADACRGLAAAHRAGLIHRDIKPANIFCASDGTVKLGDFGLAKSTRSDNVTLTQKDAVLGTPHYMSPEQCQNETLDARSDIYSLGATYYALLTGKVPFERDSALKVLYAHCTQPPPDPRLVLPDIPARCADVIQKAMAKEPGERYQNAEAMLADLQSILGGSADEGLSQDNTALLAAIENSAPTMPALPPSQMMSAPGGAQAKPWWSQRSAQIAMGAGVAAICVIIGLIWILGGGAKSPSMFEASQGDSSASTSTIVHPPPAAPPVAVAPLPVVVPPPVAPSAASHPAATEPTLSAAELERTVTQEKFDELKKTVTDAAERGDGAKVNLAVRALAGFYRTHRESADPQIQKLADGAKSLVEGYRPTMAAKLLHENDSLADAGEPQPPAQSQPASQPKAGAPTTPPDLSVLPASFRTPPARPDRTAVGDALKDPIIRRFKDLKEFAEKAAQAKNQAQIDAVCWVLAEFAQRFKNVPMPAHRILAEQARELVLKYHPDWTSLADSDMLGQGQNGPPADQPPPPNQSNTGGPSNSGGPGGPPNKPPRSH